MYYVSQNKWSRCYYLSGDSRADLISANISAGPKYQHTNNVLSIIIRWWMVMALNGSTVALLISVIYMLGQVNVYIQTHPIEAFLYISCNMHNLSCTHPPHFFFYFRHNLFFKSESLLWFMNAVLINLKYAKFKCLW